MMKYIIMALILTGCAEQQIKLVEVNKPIPMCPKPPAIPTCDFRVDQLSDVDQQNPGKVGEAYKYDMTCLRAVYGINQLVIAEYEKTSQNFDAVGELINQSFKSLNANITASQKDSNNK